VGNLLRINKKILIASIAMSIGLFFAIKGAEASISVARAFYELARQNNTQKIEALMHRGYSIESVGENGYNPVCMAVVRQDKSAYKTLVSYGAKKNPSCLKNVPENTYRRFFGTKPVAPKTPTYKSDTPYLTGAAILGTGAIITAYALRGDTSGSKKDDTEDDEKEENPDEEMPDDPKCPPNSTYNEKTKKCECNSGYGNFGDSNACYKKIDNCKRQNKDKCTECIADYEIENNKCVLATECPPNSTYNKTSKKCVCDTGYGNYGTDRQCYATIPNCYKQVKDECKECDANYVLKNNQCYAKINQCQEQDGGICKRCNAGYGIHDGDGTICYKDIEHCTTQIRNECSVCISGYGTHGDTTKCYKDVENCISYNPADRNLCSECKAGYATYGDGKCYLRTYCSEYPNTVPVEGECVCDKSRGYVGEPGSCYQASEGNYQEGDGNRDEWEDVNAKYCSSQGIYQKDTGMCQCYAGYAGKDCSSCSQELDENGEPKYIPFDKRCYENIYCDASKHEVQSYARCVCEDGYTLLDKECVEIINCGLGMEQKYPGKTKEEACVCKINFIPDGNGGCRCPTEGGIYKYDPGHDACVQQEHDCSKENANGDKWSGANCDICPGQYAITIDENGDTRCGLECAGNYKMDPATGDCTECAAGFEKDKISGMCVKSECEDGVGGYIKVDGVCKCDEENGYALNTSGVCELKQPPLIGLSNNNINNNIIELENNGEFRDIYGMKPTLGIDENKNEIYYDSIYNALNMNGAKINITNLNSGNNLIYGMYSQSTIYNASSLGENGDTLADASINIEDINSFSKIYGIYNSIDRNIYNAFSYNTSQDKTLNQAIASITITKQEDSNGEIVGISGGRNIYNAYAGTQGGVGANSASTANITIENKGTGNVVGIRNESTNGKVNNAFSYLDSAVSDVNATGNINVSGNNGVYGILGNGSIVNSETQFNKNYSIINDFGAVGNINVVGNSGFRGEAAYGIYTTGGQGQKAEVINAFGYNAKGNINVKNTKGGSAIGIYSAAEKYIETDANGNPKLDEEGKNIYIYNNVYNAFRSSEIYGGENSLAKGVIDVEITGGIETEQEAIGIYASGDVFNAFTNSGSNIKLETQGQIKVKDKSESNNLILKGIEAGGDTIANAYAKGTDKNTSSITVGTIDVEKNGSATKAYGIYNDKPNDSKGVNIFNAALINDRSNVLGQINMSAGRKVNEMYGIYSAKGTEEGQLKTVYNAYYNNVNDQGGNVGKVYGNINIKSTVGGSEQSNFYGIYVDDGIAYNAYTTNNNIDIKGTIDIEARGGSLGGEIVGMYGSGMNSKLYNTGQGSTISVKSTGINSNTGLADAYGMKGIGSIMRNSGTIEASITQSDNNKSNAYGMYVEKGTASNDEGGVITVSGNNNNYGMYAKIAKNTTASVSMYNSGTINVSGNANNYGMYANIEEGANGTIEVENIGTINLTGTKNNVGIYASGEGVTIKNSGQININGEEKSQCVGDACNNGTAIVLNGATYINQGVTNSSSSIDLNLMGGNVEIANGGSFVAKDNISGDLNVSNSTILNTFDDKVILENAIKSSSIEGLNVGSNSYMYDVKLENKENNNYDIEMNMKDFNDLTSKDKASYYKLNYENKNNSALFNALKTAQNKKEFDKSEGEILGEYVLPNVIDEQLKVSRSLDKALVSELFKDGKDVRKFVGGDVILTGRDSVSSLTGYELDAKTSYALYDKKLSNKYRLGLGLSFTHVNTDYDNNSSRKNFMVQGYVPFTYNISNGLTAVTMARIGYEDGEYTRYGYNNKLYEADTKSISYGLLNELRYTLNIGGVKLTPFVGLNAIGWYQDKINESGDDLALSLASSHVFSLESALGLYLDKEIEFGSDSKLTATLGLGYYHEFANPHDGLKSRLKGDIGHYRMKNSILDSKDRGAISAKINYDYKDFSIYGELMQYLEDEYPLNVDLGLQYKF